MADTINQIDTTHKISDQANTNGWLRLNSKPMDETIASGAVFVMDFGESKIDPLYSYRGAWGGLWPLNKGAVNGETFGQILGDQNECLQVDLNLKFDMTGVVSNGLIEAGVWKGTTASGFYWSRTRKILPYQLYQTTNIGGEYDLSIPCVPYWKKSPEIPFDDMLEGFAIAFTNLFTEPIKLVGFNVIISQINSIPR